MNIKTKIQLKWKRIAAVTVGLVALSTMSFNCSLRQFEAVSASSDLSSFDVTPGSFDKPVSPYALMTSEQTFQSMLNVTGQTASRTPAQVNEYNLRTSSMSDNDSLATINAPLTMATTSLAGEVCNGLLAREKALASANRKFFSGIDFTKGVSQNSADAYAAAASSMGQAFYGRSLASAEQQVLIAFYSEFVGSLTAAQLTAAAQTNNLYLSLCTAMLSSFDSINY